MPKLSRRSFLRTASAAAAALPFATACTAAPSRRQWQPNERIRIAVVGVRGRGLDHLRAFAALPDVEVAALCDVDRDVLGKAAAGFANDGRRVETFADVRHVLDRDDFDAISIATPNHWHSLMGIWACQAGKDVYVEKPVSHNVWEGGRLVAAARKYRRIVQTGTQCRSSYSLQQAIDWLRAGNLGRITAVHGLCYKPRPSIGTVAGDQPLPAGLDYDRWCGPAEVRPLRRRSLHYDWHWDFTTGDGDLGNQGIHQMDIARWVLGEPDLAPRVRAIGGRLGYRDDGNTPNTLVACFEYATAPLVFEVRGLPKDQAAQGKDWGKAMDRWFGTGIGVVVHCEGGYLRIPDYTSAIAFDRDGKQVQKWQGAHDHYANFVAAMRSGKSSDLAADIREGHVSSALCHLGNVSWQLGLEQDPAAASDAVANVPAASDAVARMLSHLRSNAVDLQATPLRVGRLLQVDPRSERCADAEAERLARGSYRAGFVVPEHV